MHARVVFVIFAGAAFGTGSAGRAALPPVAPVLLAAQACNCDAEAARLQESRDRLGELQERLRDLEDQRRANAAAQDAASKSLADLQAQWNKQLGGGPGSGTGTFASSGDVEVRYNAQGQIQTYRNGQPVPGSERRSPFMSGLKARMDAAEAALKKLQDEQAQIDQQIQQAQQDIAKAEQDVAARQKELEDCIRRCAAASQVQPEPQPPSDVQLADTAAVSNRISQELLRPYRRPLTFRNVPWSLYFFTGAIRNALRARSPSPFDDPLGPRVTAESLTPYRRSDGIDAGTSPAAATLGGPIVRDRLWFFNTGGAGASTTTDTSNVEQRLEGKLQPSPFSSHWLIGYFDAGATQPGLNYTGILSSSFFVEGLDSDRQFTFATPSPPRMRYSGPYFDSSDPYDRTSDWYTGYSWFPSGIGTHEFKPGAGELTFFTTGSLSHQLKFRASSKAQTVDQPTSDLSLDSYLPRLGLTYPTYRVGPTYTPEPAQNWTTSDGPHEWDDVPPRLGLTNSLGSERKALLGSSYARFADELRAGATPWQNPTSGLGVYLYTSAELRNILRNDDFWEELRDRAVSIPGGTTQIYPTPYADAVQKEYTAGMLPRIDRNFYLNSLPSHSYRQLLEEQAAGTLSGSAKLLRDDWMWRSAASPGTTTPLPGSNPTGFLQNQFELNTFYNLGSGNPAPIHFSDLPSDDAYQLIIIVYVNTGPPQRQAGMPDSLRKLIEPPWHVRLLGSIAGLFKRPGASGAAANVAYDGTAARGARPAATLVGTRARDQRGPQSGTQPPISLVATGASSGEVFQMLVHDPAGQVVAPDGLVVQPIRHGAAAPSPQRGGGAPPQSVTGYCLDYQKPPPPKGMFYRPAPDAVQQRFQPMRKILEAGRNLAESGAFKPDSTPADYATFIRQWALWTKLNNWDLNAFTREFIGRTRKNVENLGRQWNAEMESALKAAAPNRYWDILAVLAEAEGLRAAAQP